MTDLILRIFVRDHKNTEDPAVRDKCGRVAGAVGIVTNFLDEDYRRHGFSQCFRHGRCRQ